MKVHLPITRQPIQAEQIQNDGEFSDYGTGDAIVTMHFNRVVDNTATLGNAIYNTDGGAVNATLTGGVTTAQPT